MILVVDDLRTFPFKATYARSVLPAALIMAAMDSGSLDETLDELWLDHDLGGGSTIMPLVNALEERAHAGNLFPIRRIVIHSANPPGAKNIKAALGRFYEVIQVNAGAQGATSPDW